MVGSIQALAEIKTLRQYAALPYRVIEGSPQVMLITSRETRRWILPKGRPEKRMKPFEVAAAEAFEEAGVLGHVSDTVFGSFASHKRQKNGEELPCTIKVFLLEVNQELDHWPESHQRDRGWFGLHQATLMTGEPGLVRILSEFAALWNRQARRLRA